MSAITGIPKRRHADLEHTNMLHYHDLMTVLDAMALSERQLDAREPPGGHYETEYETETICGGGFAGPSTNLSKALTGRTHEVWVDDGRIDFKGMTAERKRVEGVRAWYMNIYENCSWHNARYFAGLRLAKHGVELPLDDRLAEWVDVLHRQLRSADKADFWAVDRIREDLHGLYVMAARNDDERVKGLRERIAAMLLSPEYRSDAR